MIDNVSEYLILFLTIVLYGYLNTNYCSFSFVRTDVSLPSIQKWSFPIESSDKADPWNWTSWIKFLSCSRTETRLEIVKRDDANICGAHGYAGSRFSCREWSGQQRREGRTTTALAVGTMTRLCAVIPCKHHLASGALKLLLRANKLGNHSSTLI